ncbi:MAG: response regulator transcription factor [Actinobacteria bacterium]|nr:response regulator transcription factor [Actinomycetota bacterium]
MKKVMLIDDEESLHTAIKELLTSSGYAFCGARRGQEGLQMLKQEHPDLLLLDVMLPDLNGFDVCTKIREEGRRVPIIFLSAKGDIVDKSIGYKVGGDDYVTKPFDSAELLLHILAAIRRHEGNVSFQKNPHREDTFVLGDLELRFSEHEAYVKGQPAKLTSKEFDILATLAMNAGAVFTREQIYEKVWGEDVYRGRNSITVFVRKIREKIEENPSEPKYLLTVHRIGYKIPETIQES